MPARKRKSSVQPPVAPVDPVAQFGRLLLEEQKATKERQRRQQLEREEAKRKAAEADADARRQAAAQAAHAALIADARAELDRAITAAKQARVEHRGIAEADAAYRVARERLNEVEALPAPV